MTDASPVDTDRFRREVRGFLKEHLPGWLRDKVLRHEPLVKTDYLAWQSVLLERGWMCTTWPTRYGGPGWTPMQTHIFEEECWLFGAPDVLPFGTKMLAPLIMKFGTTQQKAELLPRILRSEDWWCQGYSEPGAGSDLASLTTRARLENGCFIVNGQKTWTSFAHYADKMFCLVRTDPDASKQGGISFLLIDMRSPGVTVRPIELLDGTSEVSEVFLDDVHVPAANLLGELHQGWNCAKYLLGHERANAGRVARSKRELRLLRRLAALQARENGSSLADAGFQIEIAKAETDVYALDQLTLGLIAQVGAGKAMGPEASVLKLIGTEVAQRISALLVDALGTDLAGLPAPAGDVHMPRPENLVAQYLNWRKLSIYGGSNEVQRNIIAKAVLGI